MSIKHILARIKWWNQVDRLGPDIPTTHFFLYFPDLAKKLCKRKFASFGDNSQFRPGAYAINCSNIYIGRKVVIRPGSMLFAVRGTTGKIIIEDDVLIGSCTHIYVSNHQYSDLSRPIAQQGHIEPKPVTLKKGCWVGANVTILPGVIIGENSVVGAGSIVTKDVSAYTVVCGNPARVIKEIFNG